MDAATSFWATPGGWTLITLGQILLITVGVLVAVAFLLLADRKVWASVQMRKGPNVVGPFGLLQSFADFFKLLGAGVVNLSKSFFTQAFPEYWLFFLGALFVAVTLWLPDGIVGLWKKWRGSKA